jgi:hypothetical protein
LIEANPVHQDKMQMYTETRYSNRMEESLFGAEELEDKNETGKFEPLYNTVDLISYLMVH